MEIDDHAPSSSNQAGLFPCNKESELPQWMPTNCAIKIFSFLNRDELDTSRLVCHTWNSLITGVGLRHYQKRQIDVVELSSNYEYTVRAFYKKEMRLLTFKNDLSSIEERAVYKIIGSTKYGYPCNHFFRGNCKLNSRFKFSTRDHVFRAKYCSQKRLQIYNRKTSYKSKIFTPPLDFYVRLKWLLENSSVKHLVFIDFTFTELFVEMFEKYFGSGYEVEKLFIHNCSLKHISSQTFRQFVGRIVKAREYHLELMKGALPNHVNDDLVKMPSLLRANVILISGFATRRPRLNGQLGQHTGTFNFHLTQQGFNDYIEKRKGLIKENSGSVFGIQGPSINNAQEFIADYTREYKNSVTPNFFKYVIFGTQKFISPDGDFEIIPEPNVNQNVQDNPAPFLFNDHMDQFPPEMQQIFQEAGVADDNDSEEEDLHAEQATQRFQLLIRKTYENNVLKEPNFDMFKSSTPRQLFHNDPPQSRDEPTTEKEKQKQ